MVMNRLPPIPQEKIAEVQPWRAWLSGVYDALRPGVSGTFTTADSKTVTVVNGIITKIV